jgi:hypothetical protein
MTEPARRHNETIDNEPINNAFHPSIYAVLFGLTAWFVLSTWLFFGGTQYIVLTLGVITFFLAFAIGIPTLVLKKYQGSATQADHLSHEKFRLWATQLRIGAQS